MRINMDDLPELNFVASLPNIQSAINVSGGGDGMRVKIDIPESDIGEAVKMALYRGTAFVVTIKPLEEKEKQAIRY